MGVKALIKVLEQLLAEKKTFKRVAFETHGRPGMIGFGSERGNSGINSQTLIDSFGKFDALFPDYTKILFAGCNVADKEDGWKFLETANKVFCKRSGGLTLGWTSVGMSIGNPIFDFVGGGLYTFLESGRSGTHGARPGTSGRGRMEARLCVTLGPAAMSSSYYSAKPEAATEKLNGRPTTKRRKIWRQIRRTHAWRYPTRWW